MPICTVCECRFYEDSFYEPGEPCPCGYEVYGESAWQALGWLGVWLKIKFTAIWWWYGVTSNG